MRVLHVVPSFYPAFAYGGPVHSSLHLCLNLQMRGCEVKVLTTDANRESRLTRSERHDPMLSSLKVRFCSRVGQGMIAPGLVARLSQEAKWADLIHLTAVYNFPTLPTLSVARLYSKPLVWSPRGTLQRWNGSRRVFAKNCWERACRRLLPARTALHVTSHEEASESVPRLGNLPAWIIPNGVEIPEQPAPPASDGVLKLLFIGRLDPKKKIENLIRATTALSGLKWRLRIAGSGETKYREMLRRVAADALVSSRIEFSGQVSGREKSQAYANSDMVILPSHAESFGLVIAEALAHARPVIASRGTPWREVEQRGCGLWVDNEPESLAAAIGQLAERDRIAMGQKGRAWMQESFSWQERASSMFSLYEYLLAA